MPEPFAPSHVAAVPSPAERTPLPLDGARSDTRLLDAWCEWLGALATDAEAALAAAIAYQELDGGARARCGAAQRAAHRGVRAALGGGVRSRAPHAHH